MTQGWKRNRIFIQYILFIFFLCSFSLEALADHLSEAEGKLTAAKNRYFDGLLTGPRKTPEETERLKAKILTPAQEEVSRVLDAENKVFAGKYLNLMSRSQFEKELAAAEREEARSSIRAIPIQSVGEFIQTLFGEGEPTRSLAGGGSGGSPDADDGYSSGGKGATPTQPSKPRVIIDGRNVPKVIEFPGPKKK